MICIESKIKEEEEHRYISSKFKSKTRKLNQFKNFKNSNKKGAEG